MRALLNILIFILFVPPLALYILSHVAWYALRRNMGKIREGLER
jgi:hypothetical protein